MDILKELLTKYNYEEIASMCGVSSRTIRRYEKHGRIPYSTRVLLKNILDNEKEQSKIVEG